jgi:DNA anti-recombination protein RmuC
MDDVLLRAVDNTIRFLRMAAIELRRIAERAPEISDELRHIADQLDADANDLQRAADSSRP